MPHDHHDEDAHSLLPSEPALRVKALETILVQRGLIDPAAVDAIIDRYEHHIGPQIGAGLIARAWSDPAFNAQLVKIPSVLLTSCALNAGSDQARAINPAPICGPI